MEEEWRVGGGKVEEVEVRSTMMPELLVVGCRAGEGGYVGEAKRAVTLSMVALGAKTRRQIARQG